MPEPASPFPLAVALDGAGWHPAAWRDPSARPTELFTAGYWVDLVTEAERGLLDFVTIDDTLGLQSSRRRGPDERTDQVRGRLDAVQVAARVAPVTDHIGLVPVVTTTHTEPFHISTSLATIDYISEGRAGWQPRISASPGEAAQFGRRVLDPDPGRLVHDLFDEAADAVEVVRQLWDSWEDDAIIRDLPSGRFVDRDRLHYIDFEGRFFRVKGPSIVPRPPQGQPVVAALAHSTVPYCFAAKAADLVFITPQDLSGVAPMIEEIRTAERHVARSGRPLIVFADLVVFFDVERKARLDARLGREYVSDAAVFTGDPESLVEQLLSWRAAGLDGFRLRPGVVPTDLTTIVDGVVPALQQAGVFRTRYEESTLQARLGLPRPGSRYAPAGVAG